VSGLSAYIPCRCYHNGRSKPFPFPELEQHFRFNTEISIWYLDIPDTPANEEIEEQIDEWLADACDHENMYYFSEGLASWSGLTRFEWLLKEIGPEHCPIFLQELTNIDNTKSTSPTAAAQMLQELAYVEQLESVGSAPVLVNAETGNFVLETIGSVTLHYGSYKGNRAIADQIRLSIDNMGFCLENGWTHEEIFRSMAFEIRLVDGHTEYHALDSQQKFIHYSDPRYAEIFLENNMTPTGRTQVSFHVEIQPVLIAWFQGTIDLFKQVLQASIDIDMPIAWSD
jgi:hypothetical protein